MKTMKRVFSLLLFFVAAMSVQTVQAQTNGDVNEDGVVNEQDIAAILEIMAEAGGVKEQTKYYWYVGNGDEIVKNDPVAADIDWSKAQQITSFETLGYSVNGTQITMNNTGENNIFILCPKSWSNKWQFWNVDNTIDLTTGFAEVSEILEIPSFTKDGVEYDLWILEMYAGNIAHMRSK